MTTTTDELTGVRLELRTTLSIPCPTLWSLVADIPAIGRWSPECIGATWRDGATGPEPGAAFEARNRFGTDDDAVVRSVRGVVTDVEPGRSLTWTMLDDDGRVGSIWRYELTPVDGGGTLVRHSFEHGPGDTGMRDDASRDRASVDRRLGQLARHMSATLQAMETDAHQDVA